MHDFRWPALITIATVVLHFILAWNVGKARGKYKIDAPAMSGHPDLERVIRVQGNTLEGTMMFLPALWLFAAFVSGLWSAVLGAVWVIARVWYAIAYAQDAGKRGPAFGLSTFVFVVLTLGATWGVVKSFM
jgi:glutathione S-transferase